MSIFRVLLYIFLIYLAYRILFGFIIPLYRATRQVKNQFREMNERMNDYMKEQHSHSKQEPPKPGKKEGDYIEFEEIK
jgi:uncharacterized protein YneF (UPF0154 family)